MSYEQPFHIEGCRTEITYKALLRWLNFFFPIISFMKEFRFTPSKKVNSYNNWFFHNNLVFWNLSVIGNWYLLCGCADLLTASLYILIATLSSHPTCISIFSSCCSRDPEGICLTSHFGHCMVLLIRSRIFFRKWVIVKWMQKDISEE